MHVQTAKQNAYTVYIYISTCAPSQRSNVSSLLVNTSRLGSYQKRRDLPGENGENVGG